MNVDPTLKAAYAALLIEHPMPFEAAIQLYPNDTGKALFVAQNWQFDPEVLAEIDRLRASGVTKPLADKEEFADMVYQIALNDRARLIDRLAAARLYAEVRGFIEKPGVNVKVDNHVVPTVMVMTDHGTDAEWEAKTKLQQQRLVAENVAPSLKH